MENLWREKGGVYDVMCGSSIGPTIAEAIALSAKKKRVIKFEFNDVVVSVREDSNPELIYRDWSRALSGYIGKSVGPHPKPALTDTEKANDARIEAENERKRQRRGAEYEKKARAHREAVEAKLLNDPGLAIESASGWRGWLKFRESNQDGYGSAVLAYAERWARLMQIEMAQGKRLEDVADAASSEADLEGITGFMYGCAVSMLSQCWKYGEQLRRWHNVKTQLGNEGEKANESGGVLNPALLSISPK